MRLSEGVVSCAAAMKLSECIQRRQLVVPSLWLTVDAWVVHVPSTNGVHGYTQYRCGIVVVPRASSQPHMVNAAADISGPVSWVKSSAAF